jgi:hypothetical protein
MQTVNNAVEIPAGYRIAENLKITSNAADS